MGRSVTARPRLTFPIEGREITIRVEPFGGRSGRPRGGVRAPCQFDGGIPRINGTHVYSDGRAVTRLQCGTCGMMWYGWELEEAA